MKKNLAIAAAILAAIVSVGVGIWLYINLSKQPTETVEQDQNLDATQLVEEMDSDKPTEEKPEAMLSGIFMDADAIHKGSGSAKVTQTENGPVLVFGEDFSVTNGPDLLVYLSPNEAADPLGEFVSLGKLKSSSGAQAYNLPDNYKEFKSVTVWCRAFGVKFSYANLE